MLDGDPASPPPKMQLGTEVDLNSGHTVSVTWVEVYLRTKLHLDSSSRFTTTDMVEIFFGGAVPLSGSGAGSLFNNLARPRPTSMLSFILIRPTVWPQCTNVADRQDRTTD